MSTWTTRELEAVGMATELEIATRQPDGTLRPPVPIWVVRVGDDLYVRSYLGPASAWYRHASTHGSAQISAAGVERDVTVTVPDPAIRPAIDAQYRFKYAAYPTHVPPMLADTAADATLRLDPTD